MTTDPNRMGFAAEMQIISYTFTVLSDQFTISKDIDAKIPIIIFVGQSVLLGDHGV